MTDTRQEGRMGAQAGYVDDADLRDAFARLWAENGRLTLQLGRTVEVLDHALELLERNGVERPEWRAVAEGKAM